MRIGPQSARARLTLWYSCALSVIVLMFALGVYSFVYASLSRQMDGQLRRNLETLRKKFAEAEEDAREPEGTGDHEYSGLAAGGWSQQEMREIEEEGSIELFSVSSGGSLVFRTSDWNRAHLDRSEAGGQKNQPWSWKSPSGRLYRLQAISGSTAGREFRIIAAVDAESVQAALRILAGILLVGLPCALVLAIGGGYIIAGRVLSPLSRMAAKAREITAENLSERLPVTNPHDEFGRLSAVFNDTLQRLQDAFDTLRRFTGDASHELRTPLTAIRSVGEVALRDGGDPDACRDVVASMLEEADRLARLVDNLLTLTRYDSCWATLPREPVELTALAAEVVDCLRVLSDEKGLVLEVPDSQPITVTANRVTLRQALINLVDNAIRYTPEGGHVRVVVQEMGQMAAVEVADDGPGIAPEHRSKVFERFYRVDKARSSETGGTGLGLAVALRAAQVNGGTIDLETEEGHGSSFRILLPPKNGGGIQSR